jgi:hypothetical protein
MISCWRLRRCIPDRIKLAWKHRDQDQYFDAWALSDGTLRFIALATLFLQPRELRPPLVLVDEPELGLHPFAITLLGAMVRSASVDTQVLLATQSPLLLDEFAPKRCWWLSGTDTPRPSAAWMRTVWRPGWKTTAWANCGRKTNSAGGPRHGAPDRAGGRGNGRGVRQCAARPHLMMRGWESVVAIRMGRARSRDRCHGVKGWDVVLPSILKHLKQDAGCCVTTLVDYYGLPATGPRAWPGREEADRLPIAEAGGMGAARPGTCRGRSAGPRLCGAALFALRHHA